jgi:hypothetical protein
MIFGRVNSRFDKLTTGGFFKKLKKHVFWEGGVAPCRFAPPDYVKRDAWGLRYASRVYATLRGVKWLISGQNRQPDAL